MEILGGIRHVRKREKRSTIMYPLAGIMSLILLFSWGTAFGNEEMISFRTGRLFLDVTDLEVQAGSMSLQVRRTLQAGERQSGLLGARWRLHWESRVSVAGSVALIQDASGATFFKKEDTAEIFKDLSGEQIILEKSGRIIRNRSDGSKLIYDQEGHLTEEQDRNGNMVVLRYDKDSCLVQIEGPRRRQLKLIYDNEGRVSMILSSTGDHVRYRYVKANLTEVQVNDGPPVRYTYDEGTHLVRIERPESGTVELAYDDKSRVTSRRWADGTEELYEYEDDTNTVRHINADGGITTIRRSEDGRCEEATDPLGNTTAIEYNKNGLPAGVTGPTGIATHFRYDAQGRMVELEDCCSEVRFEYFGDTPLYTSITRADNTRQEFAYDANGNLLSIKQGERVLQTFSYYPGGLLKGIKQAGFPERTFTYHPNGLLKSETDALGYTFNYEYDRRDNLIRAVDPLGDSTTWGYDGQGRLVSETDSSGATSRYMYDQRGCLIKEIDPTGAVTRFEYDDRGRLIAETDSLGRTTRYQFGGDGQLAGMTDPAGNTLRYEYDQAGRLVRAINPAGGVFTYAYDALGRKTSHTDATGATWRYEYGEDGLTCLVTGPTGERTLVTYDPQRPEKRVTGPTGLSVSYQYDREGRLIKGVFPGSGSIANRYDWIGNLVQESDNGGPGIDYAYDALGHVSERRLPTGLRVRYQYDAVGNVIAVQDDLGSTVAMRYNHQGLLTEQVDPMGGFLRYRYDPAGRLLEETGPLGNGTKMAYNLAGELIKVRGPSGDTVKFEYDKMGLLSVIHHPSGGVTSFARNALGQAVGVTNPVGGKTECVYDKMGQLVRMVDANSRITSFRYDAAGQLIEKRLPDQKVVRYKYDAAGNLLEVDDGVFPVRYGYDEAGRRIRVEYPAVKRSLVYEYSKEDRLTRFTDSEGRTFEYEYDEFGRLGAIQLAENKTIRFAYDMKNRLTSVSYPNGVNGTWQYDAMGRPLKVVYTDASGISLTGWNYRYDAACNPIEIVDTSGQKKNFGYNAAGQLTEERGPDGTKRYSYLPGGNCGTLEQKKRTIQYSYNQADHLLKAADTSFKYDPAGNLIERRSPRGVTVYTYDAENRLVKVGLPDGSAVNFGYAPTGERVWRQDRSGQTWFVTDGQNLVAELGEDLKPRVTYLNGPGIDQPVAMWHDGQTLYYHVDLLGTVAALTDEHGTMVSSYRTDAFGNVTATSGNVPNPFIFTARYYEPALRLYYYRARYYDPELGRFISQDPLWGSLTDPEGMSRYVYCRNSPVRYTDPEGLTSELFPLYRFDKDLQKGTGLSDRRFMALYNRELKNLAQREPNLKRVAPEYFRKKAFSNLHEKFFSAPQYAPPRKVVQYIRLRQQGKLLDPREVPPGVYPGEHYNACMRQAEKALGVPAGQRRMPMRPYADQFESAPGRPEMPPGARQIGIGDGDAGRGAGETQMGQVQGGGGRRIHDTVLAQRPRRPGPLTQGRASVQKPTLRRDITDPDFINRPLTPGEQRAFGVLAGLLTLEHINNCYHNGISPADCAKAFVQGLVVGTVVMAGGIALVGVTPVVIASLALTIITHYPDSPYRLYLEIDKWEQDHIQVELAKRRQEYLRNLLKQSPQKLAKLNKSMDAAMVPLVNEAAEACRMMKQIAAEAQGKGKDAELLASKIPGDLRETIMAAVDRVQTALDNEQSIIMDLEPDIKRHTDTVIQGFEAADAWATSCDSLTTADRIKRMHRECEGLVSGIVTLANRAKSKNNIIIECKDDASKAKSAVGVAMARRDRIIILYDEATKLRQTFDSRAAAFRSLEARLIAKRDGYFRRISNITITFPAGKIPSGPEYSHLKTGILDARSHAASHAEVKCDIEHHRQTLEDGIRRVLIALEAARTRVSGETEGQLGLLTKAQGISAEGDMGVIMASMNRALEAKSRYADLPQRAEACAKRVEEKYKQTQDHLAGKDDSGLDLDAQKPKRTKMSQDELEELLRLLERMSAQSGDEIETGADGEGKPTFVAEGEIGGDQADDAAVQVAKKDTRFEGPEEVTGDDLEKKARQPEEMIEVPEQTQGSEKSREAGRRLGEAIARVLGEALEKQVPSDRDRRTPSQPKSEPPVIARKPERGGPRESQDPFVGTWRMKIQIDDHSGGEEALKDLDEAGISRQQSANVTIRRSGDNYLVTGLSFDVKKVSVRGNTITITGRERLTHRVGGLIWNEYSDETLQLTLKSGGRVLEGTLRSEYAPDRSGRREWQSGTVTATR